MVYGLGLSLGQLWFMLFLLHCGIQLFNLSDQELLVTLFLLHPDKYGLKDGLVWIKGRIKGLINIGVQSEDKLETKKS